MESTTGDADVVINRLNVALARSQKLVNSWLPQKTAEGQAEGDQDNEDDFKSMNERGGIGSEAAFDDEGLPDGAFQRRKLASNDRLMEQLLGKKAAQARKKSQGAEKIKPPANHAAPKPMIAKAAQRRQDVGNDDEEESGRASAFKSRKPDHATNSRPAVEQTLVGDGEENISRRSPQPGGRREKRKASYLDELLAEKGRNGHKKRHKHAAGK